MTVHGEREMLPAVSKAEGAKALQQFTDGFNKANRQLAPQLNPSFEGGALLAIDQAGIKAAHALRPQGNPGFTALEFKDAHFTVPQQKGWPKYFVADAASNRKNAAGQYTRWFLVFSRNAIDEKWRAVYLATFPGNKAPELKTDQDGYAEAVPAGADSGLTVDPGKLSRSYADYLNTGKGSTFASGRDTDGWRARRAKDANRPGVRIMWEDTAANYPPVALRTKDGGALVFFSTVYHQQKTVFAGATITVSGALKGLLEGPPKKTNRMAFTTVSGQTVTVPAKSAGGKVAVLNRIEAKTSVRPL
ncbi:hypothetical protein BX264_1923 [Streptomyces sp. 2333.5]|uniref:hypothetical protein n=1 Tax=Streptomyces TaxID=1883 RepID=UPI00089C8A8C|nr:hypothetical protein [Streptomyces sp. 2323.1]PJJ01613.1 hypothetical protein BX264_1923 [Streptomyces sp. 2333.5]SEC71483.1 hypothetical protein SAMN05428943_2066 [Streptomyces sp. 2314.4]SED50398.1 hypothetical protein SAMN05428942_1939 [Streptomyces sp. 2112.2]SOE14099.1 hypothetical protein SAMN06272775_5063 [Streptomyces sp. 2323.1]